MFSRYFSLALLLISTNAALGFIREEHWWPKGANVVMQLGLGSPQISLQDGTGSWNASAADAVAIWSDYLDFISFSSVSSNTAPEESGDGVNSAFFASTVFGESFGEDTLAATVLISAPGIVTVDTTEADVVVNSNFQFDSYRGPQQAGIYDFHRVMLHEFGHVLGLDHVVFNPPGQALMEPVISDFDHLGADDVAGIRFLYGAEIDYLPAPVTLRVGDSYASDAYTPNNNPTSYSAVGLPPGLAIDSVTGQITGTVTTSGNFGPVITAHGPIADAYGTYPITVLGLDSVPGLLAIVHTDARPAVADPLRPRVYAAGADGVEMIDTDTFKVTQLAPPVSDAAFRLSISADGSTLLYVNSNGRLLEHRIDLESLATLPDVPIPTNKSAILEGLDNRAYVAGSGDVKQIDATTGALQVSFSSFDIQGSPFAQIAMSPDRKTLCVAPPAGGLLTYDISTATPTLAHQLAGSFANPTISPDGQFVYCDAYYGLNNKPLVQINLSTLSSAIAIAPSQPTFPIAVALLDGSVYLSGYETGDTAASLSIFDPSSLELTSQVDTALFGAYPSNGSFDHSGKYFFVYMVGTNDEVWVLSTDRDNLPPPAGIPSKNLLNISTRARVEVGEDAMIGGFIVQGTSPKKLLLRGLGPSLPLTGALSDPVLDLYDSSGNLLASDDNWTADRLNILGTQVAPSSEREAAILMTLDPGAYTAVVHDRTNQPGQALVEVYDLAPGDSLLANISTRGNVRVGDDVMIGGFIVGGADPTEVLVRAIGPSLAGQGVAEPLADPVLELHDSNGAIISTNDNWRSTQQAEIIATNIPPTDDRESAILATLDPGSYTAIIRGQGGTTGVALVEAYNLGQSGQSKP